MVWNRKFRRCFRTMCNKESNMQCEERKKEKIPWDVDMLWHGGERVRKVFVPVVGISSNHV